MSSDYGQFQWGAVPFPLTTTSGQTLLQDADPAIFEALGFYSAMLRQHLGARWDIACAAAGLTELVGAMVKTPVSYDPVPVFQEAQFTLPVLAIYRSKSVVKQRTIERDHEVTQWGLDWILPVMRPSQLQQLYPFLKAASLVITDRTDYGFDPSYQTGRQVWAVSGVEEIGVNNVEYTWLANRGPSSQVGIINSYFPVLHMDLEVSEQRKLPPEFFQGLTGIDATMQSVSQPDPTPITVADIKVAT